jgi:Ca-activated chloride channel family protein
MFDLLKTIRFGNITLLIFLFGAGLVVIGQSGRLPDAPPQSTTSQTNSQDQKGKGQLKDPAPRAEKPSPDPGQVVGDDEVVKVSTNLTNVLVTAMDRDRRFVTTLTQNDVKVLENGVPQDISVFQRETDLPISLALLIDVSASEEATLPDEKAAAREFIQSVLRADKDKAAVISFTGDPTVEQELTGAVLQLERAIDNVEIVLPPRETHIISANGTSVPLMTDDRLGSTAIWDAIWSTSSEMMSKTPEQTRRAIILLTDGQDTSSRIKQEESIKQAIRNNVVIYAIGIGDRRNFKVEEGTLRKVSEKSGGRAFFPRNEMDLRSAFAQIQEELRSQYLIAYTPANSKRDGTFRKIQIQVTNPDLQKQKLQLLYRDGYFARDAGGQQDSQKSFQLPPTPKP